MPNTSLIKAGRAKNDEFYTQLSDIEKELKYYKKHFKDKIILCNCDDPVVSKFTIYFFNNFYKLGLKKLITTCYKNKDLFNYTSKKDDKAAYLIYEGNEERRDYIPTEEELKKLKKSLNGDGDFRSEECIDLMKESDIVVTNPPFSLFREYVAQLMKYNKKFLIIGNMNAITYKEIFPLIKNNKIWLGVVSGAREYRRPDGSLQKMGNTCWYTNLDIKKRHEELILTKHYTPEEYPKYDNYDAIEVSKVNTIPTDYDGIMGVPITFLEKYNPEQFEILGATESEGKGFSDGLWNSLSSVSQPLVNDKRKYKRLFIIKK